MDPPPPRSPQALDLRLEGSRKLKLHHLSYPLCCSEAQKLGPEVIMKMENVVWPHDSASLMCLFAVGALHTLPPPPSCLEEAEKAEFAVRGEKAKKNFPSPETEARGERDIGIDLVISPGAPSVIKHSHLMLATLGFGMSIPFQG